MDDELIINPVYQGLIRNPMILGVTNDLFGIYFCISMLAFIFSPLYGLIWLPLHGLAFLLCKADPQLATIFMKAGSLPGCKNKVIWGVKSYGPY